MCINKIAKIFLFLAIAPAALRASDSGSASTEAGEDALPECHFNVQNATNQTVRIKLIPEAQHQPSTMFIGANAHEVIMRTNDCDVPVTQIRVRNQMAPENRRIRALANTTIRNIHKITVTPQTIIVERWN